MMHRPLNKLNRRHFAGLTLLASLLFALPGTARADDAVMAFAQDLGDRVVAILAKTDLPTEERVSQLVAVLEPAINMELIGKRVLGRPTWATATDEQKAEYLTLFRELAVAQVSDILESYSFGQETYEIGKVTNLRPDRLWLVYTTIVRPERPKVNVQWTVMKKKSGDYALIEFQAEAFSLTKTKQDEFAAVVNRSGMDGLLTELRSQIDQFRQS